MSSPAAKAHSRVRADRRRIRAVKQPLTAKVTDYSRPNDGRVANHKGLWWLAQHTSHLHNGVDPWER